MTITRLLPLMNLVYEFTITADHFTVGTLVFALLSSEGLMDLEKTA